MKPNNTLLSVHKQSNYSYQTSSNTSQKVSTDCYQLQVFHPMNASSTKLEYTPTQTNNDCQSTKTKFRIRITMYIVQTMTHIFLFYYLVHLEMYSRWYRILSIDLPFPVVEVHQVNLDIMSSNQTSTAVFSKHYYTKLGCKDQQNKTLHKV